MINFSKKYVKEDFLIFLKNFLPEDFIISNDELQIEESNQYFKKATLLGSVKSFNGLNIPSKLSAEQQSKLCL